MGPGHHFWVALAISVALFASLIGVAWLAGKRWPRSRYWTFGNGFTLVSSFFFSLLFAAGGVLVLLDLARGVSDPWWYYLEFPVVLGFTLFSLRRSWKEHRERGRQPEAPPPAPKHA